MLEKSRIRWTRWVCILLLSVAAVHAEEPDVAGVAEATGAAVKVESQGEAGSAVSVIDTDAAESAASTAPGAGAEASDEIAATVAKYDWATTAYVAWLSEEQLGDMLIGQASLTDQKIWVIALTRRLTTFYKDVDWEVEGQVGKQGGPVDWNWEFNLLTDVRWNRFYWDKYVDTSLAVGLGLSYATEEPQFEIDAHGDTSQLLAYILVELALSPPKHPQWAGVIRIHHRSSAYGTFNDNIEGASNALGVGIKYRF